MIVCWRMEVAGCAGSLGEGDGTGAVVCLCAMKVSDGEGRLIVPLGFTLPVPHTNRSLRYLRDMCELSGGAGAAAEDWDITVTGTRNLLGRICCEHVRHQVVSKSMSIVLSQTGFKVLINA